MDPENILLVPSATIVPEELRLDLGPIPMAMIPLQGWPVLEHVSGKYKFDVSKHVATMNNRERIEDFISKKDDSWNEISLDSSSSLAETVLFSLESLELGGKYLYINFADTLIDNIRDYEQDVIFYDEVDYRSRWTSFSSENGEITDITEKFSEHPNGSQKVFTGVFGFKEPELFKEKLKENLNTDSELSSFFSALRAYLEDRDYRLIKAENWTDVGHLDTYHEAKKEFLNTRNFNELSVDTRKNVITKRSEDTEKLKPEIEWYDKIPSELAPYTPRIYSSSVDETGSMLEMDYTGHPSLGELLLFGSHESHIWNTIYSNIFDMLEEFESFSKELAEDEVRENLEKMYLDKTLRRLGKIKDDEMFSDFFEKEEVVINGKKMKSAGYIFHNLEEILDESGVYSIKNFCVLHGDLNFSNILYDVRSGSIKLIDPRGEFGKFDIYGDIRYDLAKMRHSVSGKYDFIINDMFEVEVNEREIKYEVFENDLHIEREKKFDEILRTRHQGSLKDVKLIESLLFLSMVPLHSDKPERQKYMITKGIELFNETILVEQ